MVTTAAMHPGRPRGWILAVLAATAILAAAAIPAGIVVPAATRSNQQVSHPTVAPPRPALTQSGEMDVTPGFATQGQPGTGAPAAPATTSQRQPQSGPAVSTIRPRAGGVASPPQIMGGDEGSGQSFCLRPKGCR